MDHQPAPPTENGAGAPRPHPDADAQRERLRAELLAAAEEEAAAIVEAARREVTVTVRRARRDLLLIRAQLRMCGLEPRQVHSAGLDAAEPEQVTPSSLDGEVPHDAIVVQRTHALRDVVTEAASELKVPAPVLEQRSVNAAAEAGEQGARLEPSRPVPEESPTPVQDDHSSVASRRRTPRGVLAAGVLVLAGAGAAAVWMYAGKTGASVGGSSGATQVVTAGAPGIPPPTAPGDGQEPPEPVGSRKPDSAISPTRILLQTIRPVWLRIDVDGSTGIGRIYPAGTTQEINPSRELSIRAGDAGAVLVAVGAEPVTTLGSSGQVVTRRISVGNAARAPAADLAVPTIAPAPAVSATTHDAAITPPVTQPLAQQASPPTQTPAPSAAAPAATASPTAPAPEPRPRNAPAQSVPSPQQAEVLARHSQWLEAYARGDQRAIANLTAEGFSLRDERPGRNASAGGGPISPAQLSDVRVDIAGVGAVVTARVRTSVEGATSESLLSEVWVRGEQQQWNLMGVRITPADGVSQPGR